MGKIRVSGHTLAELDELRDHFQDVVDSALHLVATKVAAEMSSSITAAGQQHNVDNLTQIMNLWNQEVSTNLGPYVAATYESGALSIGFDLAHSLPLNEGEGIPGISDDFTQEHLRAAENRLQGIGDHLWTNAKNSLLEGYAKDESMEQLAARVQAAAGVTSARARTIARTEIMAASNAGSHAQATLIADDGDMKEWLATEDHRTREDHVHADGQTVALAAMFTVGGWPMKYPGDSMAPAGEVINCRCTLTYVYDDSPPKAVCSCDGALVSALRRADTSTTVQSSKCICPSTSYTPRHGQSGANATQIFDKFKGQGPISPAYGGAKIHKHLQAVAAETGLDEREILRLVDQEYAARGGKNTFTEKYDEWLQSAAGKKAVSTTMTPKTEVLKPQVVETTKTDVKDALTGSDALKSLPIHDDVSLEAVTTAPVDYGAIGFINDDIDLAGVPGGKVRDAVSDYSDNGYQHVNGALRVAKGNVSAISDKPPPGVIPSHYSRKRVMDQIDGIDAAMSASRTTAPIVVHRAVLNPPAGLPKRGGAGFEWTDHAYVSTSVDTRGLAKFGDVRMEIHVPAGVGAIGVESSQPGLRSEAEILLDRGLTFRLIGQKTVDGRQVLQVEVVESTKPLHVELPKKPPVEKQLQSETTIDVSRLEDRTYGQTGVVSGADLQNLTITHTTTHPDILLKEGFDPKKGSGSGQVFGRGTYLATNTATAKLYETDKTTTLHVSISPNSKFLSIKASSFEHGTMREVAKLLPGGVTRWEKLTQTWKNTFPNDAEPEGNALRQMVMKEGYDGLLIRERHAVDKKLYGLGGGGDHLVVYRTNTMTIKPLDAQQTKKKPPVVEQIKTQIITQKPPLIPQTNSSTISHVTDATASELLNQFKNVKPVTPGWGGSAIHKTLQETKARVAQDSVLSKLSDEQLLATLDREVARTGKPGTKTYLGEYKKWAETAAGKKAIAGGTSTIAKTTATTTTAKKVAKTAAVQTTPLAHIQNIYGNNLVIVDHGLKTNLHLTDLKTIPDKAHHHVAKFLATPAPRPDRPGQTQQGIFIGNGGVTNLTHEFAQLRGTQPRGHAAGASWDSVAGVYSPRNRQLGIGSIPHGSSSVATHEFGHAFDNSLGFKGSNSQRFGALHRDLNAVATQFSLKITPYYTQAGNPNGYLSESFAETFASWAKNREYDIDYQTRHMADTLGIYSPVAQARPEVKATMNAFIQYFEKIVGDLP